MWGCVTFVHEGLNQMVPNWIAQNWTMKKQTKASIAKSSCRSAFFPDIMQHRVVIPLIFQNNLSIPPSRIKKSKQTTYHDWSLLTQSSLGLHLSYNFSKKHDTLEVGCFSFQVKKHLMWWTINQMELFSVTRHQRQMKLLRYTPENKSSPNAEQENGY
jgi:hypothetical protein